MQEELKSEGKYELCTTNGGQEVISFDKEGHYVFAEGGQDIFFSHSDLDPEDLKSEKSGKYYYIGSKSDDDPRGTLYLEDGTEFMKLEFPNGWPTEKKDPKKKIIRSQKRVKKEEILKRLED